MFGNDHDPWGVASQTPGASPPAADDPWGVAGTTPATAAPAATLRDYGAEALKGFGRGVQTFFTSPLRGIAGSSANRPSFEAGQSPLELARRGDDRAFDVFLQGPQAAPKPITEDPLWQGAEAVEQFTEPYLKPAPGWERSWTGDIGGGFGSLAGGILTSMASGPTALMLFATGGMGEAAQRAEKEGATPAQIQQATRLGTIAGATDVVDALLPSLGSYGAALGFVRKLGVRVVAGALAEGGQEGLQQLIQNAIAMGVYKPDQDIFEDVPRSAAIGAIVGGASSPALGAIGDASQRRGQPAPATPDLDRERAEADAVERALRASGSDPWGVATQRPADANQVTDIPPFPSRAKRDAPPREDEFDAALRADIRERFDAFLDLQEQAQQNPGEPPPAEYFEAANALVESFRLAGLPGDAERGPRPINSVDDIARAFREATPEQWDAYWLSTPQEPQQNKIIPSSRDSFEQVPWTAADGNPWGMSDADYAVWREKPENREAVEEWERDNRNIDADSTQRGVDFGAPHNLIPDQVASTRTAAVTMGPPDALNADANDRGELFDARIDLTPSAKLKRNAIERTLTAAVRRIAGSHVQVAFLDILPFPEEGNIGWGSFGTARRTAAGSYVPADRLVTIALADPKYRRHHRTAVHEAFHAVEHLLLTDAEMDVLRDAEPELRQIVMDYSGLPQSQVAEIADYEIRAIAFEAFAEARAEGRPVTEYPSRVRIIFDKLRQLLDRIRNFLHGNGFKSVSDVFTDVYEGKVADRAAIERGIGPGYSISPHRLAWIEASIPVDAKPMSAEDVAKAAGTTRINLVKKVLRDLVEEGRIIREGPRNSPVFRRPSPDERALYSLAPDQDERAKIVERMDFRPIDRAVRIPFDIFGGTDKRGEWKPGKYLSAQQARLLTEATFDPDGRFAWLNPSLEKARAGLVDRYGLDPKYVERDRQRGLDERRIMSQALDIMEKLKGANIGPEEAVVLQRVLTGQAVGDADMQAHSEPIRQAVDQFGQEAVDLGLLDPEAYERNRGAYLHRVYRKHETQENALSRWVSQFGNGRRKRIIGDQFKGRGIFREIPLSDLRGAGVGGTVTHEGEQWTVRGTKKNKAIIWRDFTPEEREKMGEVLDARYTVAKTYMLMARDLATGRFFRDIAQNADWATNEEPAKGTWKNAGEYNRYWTDPDIEWVRVPTTHIAETDTPKYGALAGKFVRAEIWRDMAELERMQTPTWWTVLLNQWKLNKTARSPVVHMNNVMSNLMLMDMADVRARDLVAGMRALRSGSAEYREALENGAFGGDMVSQEIRDNVLKPVLDGLEESLLAGDTKSDIKLLDRMANNLFSKGAFVGAMYGAALGSLTGPFGAIAGAAAGTLTGAAGAKRVDAFDQRMINLYRLEDEIFRMATFIRRRQQGSSPREAAIEANEQFLNYDIRAPWVNALRRTILPFFAYTYRAAPLIAKTVMTRPWKLAKYAALAYGANALAYALWPGDEDEERRSMRAEESGRTWVGTQRMMRLPDSDSKGNPLFLDVRRWMPGGDIFDTTQGHGAIDVPAWAQPSGPMMLGAELALNKQAFTGRPIVNELTDDWWDRTAKIGDWAWNGTMPSAAWIPGSWYWQKIANAFNGAEDRGGNRYDLPSAVASSFGVKVRGQDVAQGFDDHAHRFRRERDELKRERRKLDDQLDGKLISERTYNAAMAANERKLETLNENWGKVFKGRRAEQ